MIRLTETLRAESERYGRLAEGFRMAGAKDLAAAALEVATFTGIAAKAITEYEAMCASGKGE